MPRWAPPAPRYCQSPPDSTVHLVPLEPNIIYKTSNWRNKYLALNTGTFVLYEQTLPGGGGAHPLSAAWNGQHRPPGTRRGYLGCQQQRGTEITHPHQPSSLPLPQRALHPICLPAGPVVLGAAGRGRLEHMGRVSWQRWSCKAEAPAPSTSRLCQEAEAAERCSSCLSSVQLLLFKVLLCLFEHIGKLCQTNPAWYPLPLDLGKQCQPLTF